LIPLANPAKPHRSGRKRTDDEDERAKWASAFAMMHDSCKIAGFAWFGTLRRGEAFHGEFCAWLHERVHQGSPAVSLLLTSGPYVFVFATTPSENVSHFT